MGFELHKAVAAAADLYALTWGVLHQRASEKKVCKAHPEWTPLTDGELSRIDRRDRWGYTIYKNMGPAGSDIAYYSTNVSYFCRLLPMLNPQNHAPSGLAFDTMFSDKNYAEVFMPGLTFPKTVIRRVGGVFYDDGFSQITPERAGELLREHDVLVFKQTVDTGHGTGIRRLERSEFDGIYRSFSDDYIVQTLIRQHPVLAYFNESSVNVVRITSICWRGHVYILGGILRVGSPGAFCDHENKDGETYLTIPVAEDGTILPRALDVDYFHAYDTCRGRPIRGVIPQYDEMLRAVRKYHIRYPQFGLIGWDFTVDADGRMICMEFNTLLPGICGTQSALGPVFGQKTANGVPLLDEMNEALRGKRRKGR